MGTMPMACCASGLKAKMKGTGHGTGTRSSSHVFPGAFAACVGSGSLVRTCDIGAEGEGLKAKWKISRLQCTGMSPHERITREVKLVQFSSVTT
jgi:hypothetical protein